MAKSRRDQKSKTSVAASGKVVRIFDWTIIIVIALGAVFVFVGYLLPVKEQTRSPVLPEGGSIKVQLFGGCGRSSAVMDIAQLLRRAGIDVVEIEKESGYIYPSSLVVDRRGSPVLADSMARLLGLPNDRVILQRYDLIVDATIVVGLDYPQIIKKLQRNI